MATEKTPALYLNKVPFDYDYQKEKICSRSTVSLIFAAVLVALIILLTVQFLYPALDGEPKIEEAHIRVLDGEPIDVRVFSSKASHDGSKEKEHTMNPWDFEFLIDPSHLCATKNPPNSDQYQQNPEVKLLVLVPSAVDHFDRREAIRNTWGFMAEKPMGPMRLGFILGTTQNRTVNNLILDESFKHGDIIQADFVDSYYEQTTKSVLMLKWVAKWCPHAQYFLKADDDTFVNVATVAKILGTEPFISEEKFIGGYVHSGLQPSRIPEEKFYISVDDYPFEEYPPYAYGSAYVMTVPTAIELFGASKEVEPFLPLEDVFLTGLCAQYVNASRIHEPRFRYEDPPSPPSWETFSPLATAHRITPDTLELVWNDMTQTLLNHLFNQEASLTSTALLRKKRNV